MPTSEPELARIDSATADTPNIVDVHDVSVRFRDVGARDLWRVILGHPPEGKAVYDALRHVSLDVRKGEFVGLLGRNGAGKSTLLRTIGGIIEPESGEVRLLDHAIGLYGLGIAGHAQLTGRDFTRRWLELSGMPTAQVKESIEEVADFTELGEYFDRPMKTYSTGMAARVFFGAITAVEAGVYLIDEILVVGDEYFSAKSWRRLRARLAGGASGVFATHDWSSMIKLCNRAYVLNSGEITDSGNAPEVARRYIEMPELTPGYAWFNDGLATELHAVSGQDVEWRFPVTLESFGIRHGSGGHGKHKGGNGVVRRIRFNEAMRASILSGHRDVPPYGMDGGEPGATGRNAVLRTDGSVEELRGADGADMAVGDVFLVETPGGGGFGQPS